jgi:hypothetical protein
VSTTRPASLEGSLLARKGDAAPAIASDSPLLDELGEPRPNRPGAAPGSGKSGAAANALLGRFGRGLAWFADHPVYGILGLAIGIAILFAVAIAALAPPPDTVSSPTLPAPQEITIPTDGNSMTEPPDTVKEAAAELPKARISETTVAPPELPKKVIAPPEPPARVVPVPVAKPVIVAKPSGRSGRYVLQLSAVPTAQSARSELARLTKRLGRLLGNRKIIVVKAVPPGKRPIYRLRASAYDTRAAARAACNRIRKRKMACWVVRR